MLQGLTKVCKCLPKSSHTTSATRGPIAHDIVYKDQMELTNNEFSQVHLDADHCIN